MSKQGAKSKTVGNKSIIFLCFVASFSFTMVLMQQYQIYFWVLGGVALIIGLSIWYKQFYQLKKGDGDKI